MFFSIIIISLFLFLKVEQQAAFFFLMRVCKLFGLVESGAANNEQTLLLRILVPLLKLYTGKQVWSLE